MILLQSTPSTIPLNGIREEITKIPGVEVTSRCSLPSFFPLPRFPNPQKQTKPNLERSRFAYLAIGWREGSRQRPCLSWGGHGLQPVPESRKGNFPWSRGSFHNYTAWVCSQKSSGNCFSSPLPPLFFFLRTKWVKLMNWRENTTGTRLLWRKLCAGLRRGLVLQKDSRQSHSRKRFWSSTGERIGICVWV